MSPECWRHGEKEAGCEAERNARSWGSRRSRPGGAAEAFDPIHFVRKVLAPPPRRGAGAERDPGVPRLRHPPPLSVTPGLSEIYGQRTTDNGQRTTDKRKSKNPLTPGRIPAYISILMRKSVTEQSPHIQETTTPPYTSPISAKATTDKPIFNSSSSGTPREKQILAIHLPAHAES